MNEGSADPDFEIKRLAVRIEVKTIGFMREAPHPKSS